MNKNLIFLSGCIVCLLAGMSINFAVSDTLQQNSAIAIVDVAEILSNSKQVSRLKTLQENDMQELKTFIEKAQADIAKQTDDIKRKELEDKYTKQFDTKKANIELKYKNKLAEMDEDITEVIAKQAKENNFDVVLSKNVVLYGGTDITDKVKEKIK